MSNWNVEVEIKNIIDDIRHYFALNGNDENTKAVIGISGGKDSTIAAALLVLALGKDRVIGVQMPQNTQSDIDDADEVIELLGIKAMEVNIGKAYDAIIDELKVENNRIRTNLPSRLRMATLYAAAACVDGGGRVINTGNRSEAYVGYTTKYGDLAGDYAVLRDYYVTEIYEIGENLVWPDGTAMLPAHLIHKTPADGMSGKTDEDNMGFTYQELDNYLRNGVTPEADVLQNIIDRHQRNKHKELIHIPHPISQTRPYVRRNTYRGYVEEEMPFSF